MLTNPLIRKLELFTPLSDDDKRRIEFAIREVRTLPARQDIISEDDCPNSVHLLLEGWAARYKLLASGGRAILGILIPGDVCDIHVALLRRMDHSIGTVSAATIAYIARDQIEALLSRGDNLSRALMWCTLVDEAILREWLVGMGHRASDQRVAHFICEMMLRSTAVGLSTEESFDLPLTQEQFADTMGITTVHMNRVLQKLRAQRLITTQGKEILINNFETLAEFADFNPNYLHQEAQRNEQSGITR